MCNILRILEINISWIPVVICIPSVIIAVPSPVHVQFKVEITIVFYGSIAIAYPGMTIMDGIEKTKNPGLSDAAGIKYNRTPGINILNYSLITPGTVIVSGS